MKIITLLNPKRKKRAMSRKRSSKKRRRVVGYAVGSGRIRRRKLNPTHRRRKRRSSRARSSRRRSLVVRLNPTRRARRSIGSRIRSGVISLKSITDKKTLAIAGGAVASSIVSGYVLTRWGERLPGNQSTYGRMAYQLALPVGAAILLRKKTPNFAMGLLIGGVASAIQSGLLISGALNMLAPEPAATTTTEATSAYLNAGGLSPVSAMPPGYSAVDAFGDSPYASNNAFGPSF